MRTYTHQGQHHPARGTRGHERRWGALLFVALVLIGTAGTHAFGVDRTSPNDSACSLTQLTYSTQRGSFSPTINAAGTHIAFNSSDDLTGDNPDGSSEIFLVNTLTRSITQLTHATQGTSSGRPSINAAGTHIAFDSNADLTGDNPDGSSEIFLVNTLTRSITQLTHATQGFNVEPAINAAGTLVAFVSNADLTGDNPDGSFELFLVNTLTKSLTQLTHASGDGVQRPSISAAGTRIAFDSSDDLTGDNPDGSLEIFLVNTRTDSLIQVTYSTAFFTFSQAPSINAAGTRVAFVSDADPTGDNPDGNLVLFLANTLTKSLTQLTQQGRSFDPAINAAGTHIAFVSDVDPTGDNPDGNLELFLANTRTHRLIQITYSTQGRSLGPAINAAGTHIAFDSNADLTGDNPDGIFQIFLASCVGTGHDLGTMTREETGEQER